jgi:hypothetical protein
MGATGSEFQSATVPKARKEYRCEYCGQKILKGEKHYKFNGVWEGDFKNWRMHLECEEAAQLEDLSEGFSPYEGERPAKLVPVAEPSHTILRTDHTCTDHTESDTAPSTT